MYLVCVGTVCGCGAPLSSVVTMGVDRSIELLAAAVLLVVSNRSIIS